MRLIGYHLQSLNNVFILQFSLYDVVYGTRLQIKSLMHLIFIVHLADETSRTFPGLVLVLTSFMMNFRFWCLGLLFYLQMFYLIE